MVFGTSGIGRASEFKLRRGFQTSGSLKPTQDELRQQKEEEMDDYCSQVPVGHLVFMVHGIGQRLEKANLVDDVGDFRRITSTLADVHLTTFQKGTQRVLFIPCQWRKGLKLSGESAVDDITLDGVRGLRVTLSATVHDVLYYMSPIYCQHIIDSVSNQLNKLYAKFLKRNPDYSGKVSLYGHSLGSVLSYDILCHQECVTYSPTDSAFIRGSTEQEPKNDVHFNSVINRNVPVSEIDKPSLSCGSLKHMEYQPTTALHNGPKSDDCLKSAGFSYTTGGSLDLGRLTSNEEPCSSELPPVNVDCEKPCIKSETTFYTKGPEENFDIQENSIVNEAKDDLFVGDATGEDNKITLLKEEVSSLRRRIAELEQQRDKIWTCKDRLSLQNSDHDVTRKTYAPYRYTKLNFKVDTFFAVGSPLGVFLALRNIRIGIGKGGDYWQDENISEEIPSCRLMFNIFHPFDPVAYRVEPLICKEYISKRPVIIPYHRGGKRLHIGFQEFTDDMAARSEAIAKSLNVLKVKMVNVFQSKVGDDLEAAEDNQQKEKSYGSLMIERLTGDENGRVDHVLQSKTFQHPYISALGAHTNYWRDPDTALFILKHLYRDIPEVPHEGTGVDNSSRVDKAPATNFYEDFLDEDFPLTFSDHSFIREFSRKAKKATRLS